jgi:hypothetical protein
MKPWQYQGFLLDTLRHFKNMEGQFKIKSYGYGELAQLYFPTIAKKSASAQLRRWIKKNNLVFKKLLQNGYQIGNRILTPTQVKTIVDEFGEPY